MNRSFLGRAVFTIAVGLGLGYGVQEVVASEPQRSYCEYCDQMCKDLYGPGAIGLCGPRGCYCF